MKVVESINEIKEYITKWKREGLKIGFVPTMGYLHEGHESLIKRAVSENERVVVSVFVNPIQFGQNEDLAQYPRDLKRDSELCEKNGVAIVFHPKTEEMYPEGFSTRVKLSGVTEGLCGKSRPGHFDGVCTVVLKLFHIVMPDYAYFGQKDAQQLLVIKKMVRELNMPIHVVGCPIIREKDGLAKSSRNTYLSEEQRQDATILYHSLIAAKERIKQGEYDAKIIKKTITEKIGTCCSATIDYIEIVDLDELRPLEQLKEGKTLIALAVYIGNVRLIDNMIW